MSNEVRYHYQPATLAEVDVAGETPPGMYYRVNNPDGSADLYFAGDGTAAIYDCSAQWVPGRLVRVRALPLGSYMHYALGPDCIIMATFPGTGWFRYLFQIYKTPLL